MTCSLIVWAFLAIFMNLIHNATPGPLSRPNGHGICQIFFVSLEGLLPPLEHVTATSIARYGFAPLKNTMLEVV